jgi:hypothetical protein
MAGPKRQHFVPRAFLQRFGCEGKVAMRRRGQGRLIITSAWNEAVESGFYTTDGVDGGKSTELEAALADVDGAATMPSPRLSMPPRCPPRVHRAARYSPSTWRSRWQLVGELPGRSDHEVVLHGDLNRGGQAPDHGLGEATRPEAAALSDAAWLRVSAVTQT